MYATCLVDFLCNGAEQRKNEILQTTLHTSNVEMQVHYTNECSYDVHFVLKCLVYGKKQLK